MSVNNSPKFPMPLSVKLAKVLQCLSRKFLSIGRGKWQLPSEEKAESCGQQRSISAVSSILSGSVKLLKPSLYLSKKTLIAFEGKCRQPAKLMA